VSLGQTCSRPNGREKNGHVSEKAVEQKLSETALFNALHRAIANKKRLLEGLGSDDLAVPFLPPLWRFIIRFKSARAIVKKRLASHLPGLHDYVMTRTAYLDRLFFDALTEKTARIVLLGAGYDSRPYRFAQSGAGPKIFELDAAPTQNRRARCLRQAGIDVPHHVGLVLIDFDRESLMGVL